MLGRRTLGHVLALLSGTAATAAIGFLTHFALARMLSLESYGRLAAILAAANFLTPLAGCGMGVLWLELFGREGWAALRWMPACLKSVAISSAIAAGLMVYYVFFSQPGSVATATLIAMLAIPIVIGQGLADITSARLQLEERY